VAGHHQPGGRVGGAGSAAPAGRRGLPSFASVYKDFQELTDFERELGILLQKRDPSAGGASGPAGTPGSARRLTFGSARGDASRPQPLHLVVPG